MRKIFISHKRKNGQASTEAILVKNQLEKEFFYKSFMDVREDYIGEFPKTLMNKIRKSDAFILIIPSDLDLSFLLDTENWVHKEVKHVLYLNKYCNRNIKIIPISFVRNFIWDKSKDYGEIKDLLNYNILYYDTNDAYSGKKMIKSIGAPKSKYMLYSCCVLLLCAVVLFLPFKDNSDRNSDRVIQQETKTFIEEISKYNSLSTYSNNSKKALSSYLDWYTKELSVNRDFSINMEFSETYLKYVVLKTLVLSYIGFAIDDLKKEQDASIIDEIINDCYSNIPEALKSIFSFNGKDKQARTIVFEKFLDNAIDYLQNKTTLKKMPSEFIPRLKQQCLESLWVNSEFK